MSSGSRFEDLYRRVPKGSYNEKKGKTKEELEMEAHKDEFTFAPKINKPKE